MLTRPFYVQHRTLPPVLRNAVRRGALATSAAVSRTGSALLRGRFPEQAEEVDNKDGYGHRRGPDGQNGEGTQ
jgi:hypothetical protein